MTEHVIDFESVIVDVKDEIEAFDIARRLIKEGDIQIDRILNNE